MGESKQILSLLLDFGFKKHLHMVALIFRNVFKINCFDFYYFIVEKKLTFRNISDTHDNP